MSKAVLVMDMPESCDMCDFADDTQPPRLWRANVVLQCSRYWR